MSIRVEMGSGPQDQLLHEEVNPAGLKRADLVVGLPSLNEAENINWPTLKADEGLNLFFPDYSKVIINCDNSSPDDTKTAFLATPTASPKIYLSTPPGVVGRGANIINLLQKALDLKAKAVLILGSDLKSVNKVWLQRLLAPLLQYNLDYLNPIYIRDKNDALITSALGYPLTRSLFARRIRQPLLVDQAFSGRLAEIFLKNAYLHPSDNSYVADLKMIWTSLLHKAVIGQSFIAYPRITRPRKADRSLARTFSVSAEAMFKLMPLQERAWLATRWSKPTPIFGCDLTPEALPPPSGARPEETHSLYRDLSQTARPLWAELFSPQVLSRLNACLALSLDSFSLPSTYWCHSVYEAAAGYNKGVLSADEVMTALTPLFFAKVTDFILKTSSLSLSQARELQENEARIFEEQKPWLLERWPPESPAAG